ncbi:MAG: hypothetical protein PUC71_08070 [Oscillospiraceae bacterium]|nr:hypothetical protein [Oscillospiraceae bacterium]
MKNLNFDLPEKPGWQIKISVFPKLADQTESFLLLWQIKNKNQKLDLPQPSTKQKRRTVSALRLAVLLSFKVLPPV